MWRAGCSGSCTSGSEGGLEKPSDRKTTGRSSPTLHLHPDVGGLPVSGDRARRLQPPGRRLGDGGAPAHRARAASAPDGDLAAAAHECDPSQRSGLSVHVDRVRQALRAARSAPVDRQRRRRVRQRNGGELLRHARVRAARSHALRDAARGASGGVRVDRGLVQPAPASFVDWLSVTDRVRTTSRGGGRTRGLRPRTPGRRGLREQRP